MILFSLQDSLGGQFRSKTDSKSYFLLKAKWCFFFVADVFFLSQNFHWSFLTAILDFLTALEQNSVDSPIDSELKFVISTLKDHYNNYFYPYEK